MVRHAIQAMAAAEEKIVYLQEQLDMTAGSLQQEREATQRALDLFSNSLLVRLWKNYSFGYLLYFMLNDGQFYLVTH